MLINPASDKYRIFFNIKSGVLALCIIISFSLLFSGPIWDTDFWWHLSTGRYIVTNWSLLGGDPFSFTAQQITEGREAILNGYWLAQALFYLCYKLLGLYGIVLLRAALFISIFVFLYFWGKKGQADDFILLLLLVMSAWFSRYYTGMRPQLFSFLFTPLAIYLLADFKEKAREGDISRWIYVLLPALMLVWANCHRGFIIGPAIMGLYLAAETFRITVWRAGSEKKYLGRLVLLASAAVAASLVNPNGYKPYLELLTFQNSMLQQMTSEYVSPVSIAQYGVAVWPYWTYMAIAILTLLLSRKNIGASNAVIVLFLAVLSLSAFRYIPFFMYATIPIIAIQATHLIKDRRRLRGTLNRVGMPLVLLAMAYVSIMGYKTELRQSINHPIMEHRFPVEGARFVKQRLPEGNLYNNFEWGGYLIWELYPHHKVFIDGRALNQDVFIDAMDMMWDSPRTPLLFDKYGIDIVMIPRRDKFTGEFYTVINYLMRDNRWRLVYADKITLIFLRS